MYKEEVETRIAAVRTKLGERGIEEEIKGIGQVLSLLESEGRAQRNTQRREQLLQSASVMRKELEQLSEESRRRQLLVRQNSARVEPEGGGGRGSLLEGDDEENPAAANKARRGNKSNEEHVGNSRAAIDRSKKILSEIESTGLDINENLDSQTQKLKSSIKKVDETNRIQSEARQVLRSIEKGETRSKLIMYGAVSFVVVALIVAFYYILF